MKYLAEKLMDHYKYYLGDYIGADLYSDELHEIQLLGFDEAIENCLLFATFGLSKYSEDINNCCEIIMAVDRDYDQCAELLMNSVFYVVSNEMNFGRGILVDGIENINNNFYKQHNKAGIYFTENYIFPNSFVQIEDSCKMYMAFFVSKQEANYIKKYGCEKFEDLLEKKNVDVIEIDRISII